MLPEETLIFLPKSCLSVCAYTSFNQQPSAWNVERERLPTAMAIAATIKPAATAKVIRIPAATASGRAVVIVLAAAAKAKTAPMTDL